MINKLIPKTEFSRNVANVAGGSFIAQAITIGLSPVLTRIFSPADFGLYSIFINIAATAGTISTFRYELAVMLPPKEEEAANVATLSFFISLCYSLAISVIVLIGGNALMRLLKAEAISEYILLAGIYVFFFGIAWTLNYWLSRVKMFKRLSWGKVAQSGGTAIFSIALFYLGWQQGGLIVGAVLGQMAIGLLYLIFVRKDLQRLVRFIKWKTMKEMFRRYIHFLTYNTPHSLLSALQDLLVAGIILYYFGAVAAGLYFMCYRILKLPAGLISTSTYQVFFQRVSELYPDGKAIQYQIKKVLKQLSLIAIAPFGLLLIAGPLLFSLVFGKEWYEAGVYAQLLVPSLMSNFILSPVTAILLVAKMQRYGIIIAAADITLRTVSLLIGAYYNSIYIGLACLSGSNVLLLLFFGYWLYHVPVSNKMRSY